LLPLGKNFTFERRSDKIAVAPEQPTPAHRAEIVERNTELGRHYFQAVQSKAGAMVGDIANTTGVDAVLASEEHQYVAIDRRTADGASLDVTSRLKHSELAGVLERQPHHDVRGYPRGTRKMHLQQQGAATPTAVRLLG
jgi:hypothetical protein